jgi:hypothetical protein
MVARFKASVFVVVLLAGCLDYSALNNGARSDMAASDPAVPGTDLESADLEKADLLCFGQPPRI